MKKILYISLRVFFVLILIGTVAFFGFRSYFLHQSQVAISQALVVDNAPIIGDKSAPFSIVEFFDYQCPHCAEMSKLVGDVVAGDTQTKVILRPVVFSGQETYLISSLVLAAEQQQAGASVKLHNMIMGLGHIPDLAQVKSIAAEIGIDVARAEKDAQAVDIRAALDKNTALVRRAGFYSVPALIIGDKGFLPRQGLPGINELKLMILDAKSRLNGK